MPPSSRAENLQWLLQGQHLYSTPGRLWDLQPHPRTPALALLAKISAKLLLPAHPLPPWHWKANNQLWELQNLQSLPFSSLAPLGGPTWVPARAQTLTPAFPTVWASIKCQLQWILQCLIRSDSMCWFFSQLQPWQGHSLPSCL